MKIRALLANFADLLGALILLGLSLFQILLVGDFDKQEMRSRDQHVRDQIYDICFRLSNLELVTGQSDRNDIPRDCGPYESTELAFNNNPWHLTWMEGQEIFGSVQFVIFLIGAILFCVGAFYRVYHVNK